MSNYVFVKHPMQPEMEIVYPQSGVVASLHEFSRIGDVGNRPGENRAPNGWMPYPEAEAAEMFKQVVEQNRKPYTPEADPHE